MFKFSQSAQKGCNCHLSGSPDKCLRLNSPVDAEVVVGRLPVQAHPGEPALPFAVRLALLAGGLQKFPDSPGLFNGHAQVQGVEKVQKLALDGRQREVGHGSKSLFVRRHATSSSSMSMCRAAHASQIGAKISSSATQKDGSHPASAAASAPGTTARQIQQPTIYQLP